MLGLTQLEERIIWIAIVVVVIIGFAWHERHLGAEKCIQGDEKAAAIQEAHNADILSRGTTTVFQEAAEYHEAIATPVAHPVRVMCESPRTHEVPAAAASGPVSNGAASLPGPDHSAPVPDQSIGPELQAVGRDADAQIIELQDYIRRVCSVR